MLSEQKLVKMPKLKWDISNNFHTMCMGYFQMLMANGKFEWDFFYDFQTPWLNIFKYCGEWENWMRRDFAKSEGKDKWRTKKAL